jgi:outer membrane protein assembly factor BamB
MNHRRLISWMNLSLLVFAGSHGQPDYREQWPGFRGPFATGIIEQAHTPVEWDTGSGRNILWKKEIPGLGHASPVIWHDRIFVTTAVSGSGEDYLKVGLYGDIDMVEDETIHEFKVFCLDKRTG